MNNARKKPVVFVSSTCYDLANIRADLKSFIEDNYGFEAMLSEFNSFPIDPCIGTFENCLSNVDQCADIFILIVGTRYGYVTDTGKSITNLEYLHAKAKGIPIYVFVKNQLKSYLPIWRANKNGDFSVVVDNTKIFEFVDGIYDESHQWVYTYDDVPDIKMTLKNQLSLIFAEGLKMKAIASQPQNAILKHELPPEAVRMVIEKPYCWEHKFLAFVMKDEIEKMQVRKWDLKYGFFTGEVLSMEPRALLDDIITKLNEALKVVEMLGVLFNKVIQEAIAAPGTPSDLEMMVYSAKRMAFIYERLVGWALYFKSILADERFDKLLGLLYEMPKSALRSIDDFVDELHKKYAFLPDTDDGVQRNIAINCVLDESNLPEINEEIQRVGELLILEQLQQ